MLLNYITPIHLCVLTEHWMCAMLLFSQGCAMSVVPSTPLLPPSCCQPCGTECTPATTWPSSLALPWPWLHVQWVHTLFLSIQQLLLELFLARFLVIIYKVDTTERLPENEISFFHDSFIKFKSSSDLPLLLSRPQNTQHDDDEVEYHLYLMFKCETITTNLCWTSSLHSSRVKQGDKRMFM